MTRDIATKALKWLAVRYSPIRRIMFLAPFFAAVAFIAVCSVLARYGNVLSQWELAILRCAALIAYLTPAVGIVGILVGDSMLGWSRPKRIMPISFNVLAAIGYLLIAVAIPMFFGLDGANPHAGAIFAALGAIQLLGPMMVHRKADNGEYEERPELLRDDTAWCVWQLSSWIVIIVAGFLLGRGIPDGDIKWIVGSMLSVVTIEALGFVVRREVKDGLRRKPGIIRGWGGDGNAAARKRGSAAVQPVVDLDNIVSIDEFEKGVDFLGRVGEGRAVFVIRDDRPASVIITPDDYRRFAAMEGASAGRR